MSDEVIPHVVSLSRGELVATQSLDHVFGPVFSAYIDRMREDGKTPRVVFFAHGGLVDVGAALKNARRDTPWWLSNDIFPVFFVWDTGFWSTLSATFFGPRRQAFGTAEDISNWVTEKLVRELHERQHLALWTRMKDWAAISVGVRGGLAVVAETVLKQATAHPDIRWHAIGHSAGAILHSHFLPFCLGLSPDFSIESLHLLAPAITVGEFRERLFPHMGRGIGHTSVFTMREGQELDDICEVGGKTLYRNSLLYLIYHSLEAAPQTPILGLQASLTSTRETPLEVRRALGLLDGAPSRRGDVIFGPTNADAPRRSATRAIHHGDFDDDAPTMESVARRILGKTDADPIAAFAPPPTSALIASNRVSFGPGAATASVVAADVPADFLAPTPEQLDAAKTLRDALDAYLAAFAE